MAGGAGDHDFAQIKNDLLVVINDKLANARIPWEPVCRVEVVNAPSLTLADVSGIGSYSTTTASPTGEDIKTSSETIASVSRVLTANVYDKDLRDSAVLVDRLGAQFAASGLGELASLFSTGLAGLFTLAHPDLVYAGAGKKFIDSFSETITQSNKLTTALSRDAVATARRRLRAYQNKAGLELGMDVSNDQLALVVPTELMDDARDIVTTSGPTYDGTGLVSGSFEGIQVLDLPYLSDVNDWFLIHKPSTPLVMWVRMEPDMRITQSPTAPVTHFVSEMEAVFTVEPFEGGIVGSSVT